MRERVDAFFRDLVHATRLLRRRPASTATAILSLAIGVGLNTAVFSVVNGVLWRELPLVNGDRLVLIGQVTTSSPDPSWLPSTGFLDVQRASKTLDQLAAGTMRIVNVVEPGEPAQIGCLAVSQNYFDVLGVRPARGRAFAADDYASSLAHWAQTDDRYTAPTPRLVIISHGVWQRRFLGDPDIVGKRLRLAGGNALEVVGVMGPEVDALGGLMSRLCWIPEAPDPRQESMVGIVSVIGRRAPGVSLGEVNAEMDTIGRNKQTAFVSEGPSTFRAVSLLDSVVGRVRTQLTLLFGAVVCVLLVTCANVVNLFLAHAASRRDELATRVALGASRTRLARQMLTESLLISVAGGVCGFLIAVWGVPLLVAIAPRSVPRLDRIGVDWATFTFAALVSGFVGVLCGLLGSLPARRVRPIFGSVQIATTPTTSRFRQALTVGEIALALMLVVGATLMVRTVRSLNAIDLGFDPAHVVFADLSAIADPSARLIEPREFQMAVVERVKALPGVRAAGVGGGPLAGSWMSAGGLVVPGDPRDFGSVLVDPVSPGYFEALGARLVAGRFFERNDTIGGAPSVIVVNEAAARLFWRGSDPIGRTIEFNKTESWRVIGVVANLRGATLEAEPGPTIYQLSSQSRNFGTSSMAIKVDGDPQALVPAIRSIIRSFSRVQPFRGVTPLQDRIDSALAPRVFVLRVIGLFSVLGPLCGLVVCICSRCDPHSGPRRAKRAKRHWQPTKGYAGISRAEPLVGLILAVVGVYGMLAEYVGQRVPEIGLRMAFGATASDVLRLILRQGAWLASVGVGLGLLGAMLLRDVMSTFVYGVETLDPLTYLISCLCLLVATAVACTAPARRASRLDPVAALRGE